MTVKRDNGYYERVLKRDHPDIHRDYRAGKFRSMREARRAAGLLSERTPLHELKNAWRKASKAERDEFEAWVAATPKKVVRAVTTADRRLTDWAAKRIRTIMAARGLQSGDLMRELGLKALDPSVMMAIKDHRRLAPSTVTLLRRWLSDNTWVR